jgi:hypothetical protein
MRRAFLIIAWLTAGCGTKEVEPECPPNAKCIGHPKPLVWQALPSAGAPKARYNHTAVWTGSEMLVWGGAVDAAGNPTGDGAAYNPASDTWRPIASAGAPSARHRHSAVWTGKVMLVWGGFAMGGLATGGGAYDPAADKWTALPTKGEPPGRTYQRAEWTGTEMMVWGGLSGATPLDDGGRFDPAAGTWKPIPTGGPTKRKLHGTAWTGSELVVWGGGFLVDWNGDGRRFDPATNSWPRAVAKDGAPVKREAMTAVWTGSAMLVWGGWNGGTPFDDGALYDPAADTWTALPGGAPEGRMQHVGVWAEDELVVWGGCGGDACMKLFADGGRYSPVTGWTKVAAQPALSERVEATGVWTGHEIIVWGGGDAMQKPLGTGARSPL